MICANDDPTLSASIQQAAAASAAMPEMGHKRTSHTLIRHVDFSAETRPRDAMG
jgi:hypothetical protein